VTYAFHHRLIVWLERPLPPERRHLLTLSPAEPFLTSFKVSLMAGVGLALPVILWQVWSFLAPAFEEHSQRMVAVFVVFASALLVVGVAFGYFLVLPQALHFLTHYDEKLYTIQIRAKDYFSFALAVLAAVGVVFELPIFVLALVRLGILTTRTLRRNRRLGYFIVAVIAVLLPGVDPVTTTFEGLPLVALYEGSIWLAVLMERRWGMQEVAPEPS
jgi:sec-independent protein translocase protein TatC